MAGNARNNGRRTYSGGSRGRGSRKRKQQSYAPIFIGLGVIVVLLVILAVIKFKGAGGAGLPGSGQESSALAESGEAGEKKQVITRNTSVDLSAILNNTSGIADDNLIDVTGMTAGEISQAISDRYTWALAVVNPNADVGAVVKPKADINQTTEAATLGDAENPDHGDNTNESSYSEISVKNRIEVPDLIAERIPAFVDEIIEADKAAAESLAAEAAETSEEETTKKKKKSKEETTAEEETTAKPAPDAVFVFAMEDYEDELADIAGYAADMWYVEPLGGSIGSYDAANDKFIMENSRNGFEVNKDQLTADLRAAVGGRRFSDEVAVTGRTLSAEDLADVTGSYAEIASYTTNTTSNSVRNKNIQLACSKLNGTIVRPGEEFSFNNTVGQRTKEGGYGEAAAYNNGEVVQEVGGGVCQVSTTLYNAVLKAGLKVTARQSHTFKPTYVTPGQDATVSWGGPDFRFANLPSKPEYAYDTNYAIGIRASYSKQTVTVSIYGRPVLKSGYTFALSSVQTKTIEKVRKLIEPGSDKQPTKGDEGSVWETRLIIKKDGEVVSNNVDHNAYYTGHIEYYTEETSSETESESDTDEGGIISDVPELGPQGPGGPGGPGVIQPSTASDSAGPTGGSGSPGSSSGTVSPGSTGSSGGSNSPGNASPGSSDSSAGSPDSPSGSSSGSSGSNSPGSSSDNSPGSSSPGSAPAASSGGPSSGSSSGSSSPGSESAVSADGPSASGSSGSNIGTPGSPASVGSSTGPVVSAEGPGSLSTGGTTTGGPGG